METAVRVQDVSVRWLTEYAVDHRSLLNDWQLFLNDPVVWLEYDARLREETVLLRLFKVVGQPSPEDVLAAIFDRKTNGFYHYLSGVCHPDWCCAFASVDHLREPKVLMIRFPLPVNFGSLVAIRLLVLVLTPAGPAGKFASIRTAKQVAESFATLLEDETIRRRLLNATSSVGFIQVIEERFMAVANGQSEQRPADPLPRCSFGRGIRENLRRRWRYYLSDYRDGLDSWPTVAKVCSATLSLFFACILPCVAFGVLDQHHTGGAIGPKEALLGQAIGGMVFAVAAGQPLVIIATTAPLCLYIAIVHRIAVSLSVDFFDLFAAVGLWNAMFLTLYAVFDVSQLMNRCTRFTEETFATFIFFAFIVDAGRECAGSFERYYHSGLAPEKSILFLFLMLGTVILGLWLLNFSSTPYFTKFFRQTIADYSLPLAVMIFAFIGSYLFGDINPESFDVATDFRWRMATMANLKPAAIGLSFILGIGLSILFFIDQNISGALVNAPSNRLQKGDAYHWDLLLVGILNLFLSFAGLPWMHGILPHSPMHVQSLADYGQGKQQPAVIRARETRITGILIHLLIGLVAIFLPTILSYIPVAVLCGLFLYCSALTLHNNSLYQRFRLLFTEPASYPANVMYLQICPIRTVHLYTGIQLTLLAVIGFFGFAPWEYVQLLFPLVIACLIPFRLFVLPKIIDPKHLDAIDTKHSC